MNNIVCQQTIIYHFLHFTDAYTLSSYSTHLIISFVLNSVVEICSPASTGAQRKSCAKKGKFIWCELLKMSSQYIASCSLRRSKKNSPWNFTGHSLYACHVHHNWVQTMKTITFYHLPFHTWIWDQVTCRHITWTWTAGLNDSSMYAVDCEGGASANSACSVYQGKDWYVWFWCISYMQTDEHVHHCGYCHRLWYFQPLTFIENTALKDAINFHQWAPDVI